MTMTEAARKERIEALERELGAILDLMEEGRIYISATDYERAQQLLGRIVCPDCHGCGGCGEHEHDLVADGDAKPGWENGCPRCSARGWVAR